jgi:hypothetical protein
MHYRRWQRHGDPTVVGARNLPLIFPGDRYGRLTVVEQTASRDGRRFLCECDCGTLDDVAASDLRRGKVQSCGCLRHDKAPATILNPGDRFGRLTVIKQVFSSRHGKRRYQCRCICGTLHEALGTQLRSGRTQSCGCLERESRITHGLTGNYAYNSWKAMLARCLNPAATGYEYYGARGITVCDRWRGPGGLANFIADIGPRPPGLTAGGAAEYTRDRVNPDGNYEPGNVRWASRAEQARNKRPRQR